ncbi:DUF6190 family protein [Streptomyces sp. NPDC087440]|uniref:DUF6190 family protein n=1 Tax=Streptomyces sp. NPDC087440 TaxID=3365790 RepID=UPI0037F6A2A3
MPRDVYVDASLFMGMHSKDPDVRTACARFFAEHLRTPVLMTYEEVGRCDDVVWGRGREEQDAYYPFMDVLHSLMPIRRRAYTAQDRETLALLPSVASDLAPREQMLLASVRATGGELVTVNPRLLALAAHGLPVRAPRTETGPVHFDDAQGVLDALYETSLALEVDHAAV